MEFENVPSLVTCEALVEGWSEGRGQQDVINTHLFVLGGRSAILTLPATYYISIFGCSGNVCPPPPRLFNVF